MLSKKYLKLHVNPACKTIEKLAHFVWLYFLKLICLQIVIFSPFQFVIKDAKKFCNKKKLHKKRRNTQKTVCKKYESNKFCPLLKFAAIQFINWFLN